MASFGLEKYSLAIQFIFSSLENFENPATSLLIFFRYLFMILQRYGLDFIEIVFYKFVRLL